MQVIVIWPAIKLCGWGCHHAGASNEAALSDHGLAMIASNIEAVGHRVQLLDMRGMKGWPDFENAIINTGYDVACISFHSGGWRASHASRPNHEISGSGGNDFQQNDTEDA